MTPSPEQSYSEVPLTRGYVALVDSEDFAWLSQWKWSCNGSNGNHYAIRAEKISRTRKSRMIFMHREILSLRQGDPRQGDHINGNRLDNRRSNLRICDRFGNAQNHRVRKDNKTGMKGVYAFRNQWRAVISEGRKRRSLGLFPRPEMAHSAYLAAAETLHGEFRTLRTVKLGIPGRPS